MGVKIEKSSGVNAIPFFLVHMHLAKGLEI
jgi:hypothetical protein